MGSARTVLFYFDVYRLANCSQTHRSVFTSHVIVSQSNFLLCRSKLKYYPNVRRKLHATRASLLQLPWPGCEALLLPRRAALLQVAGFSRLPPEPGRGGVRGTAGGHRDAVLDRTH